MSSPVLVTGGTGTLGRALIRALLVRRREVRVLSRKPRPGAPGGAAPSVPTPGEPEWFVGDLLTGVGVAAALDGVVAVVHCATNLRGDAKMGAQLAIAGARAGAPHIVFPSEVGCDLIRTPHYRDKRAVERILEDGQLPWTVVRCTHFHESLDAYLQHSARFPMMWVPAATKFQPISAVEVAARLADLAWALPANRVADLGGPEVRTAMDLTTMWLSETGRTRKLVEVTKRGKQYDGWRSGAHLAPESAVGEQTFAEYLVAMNLAREAEALAVKADREQARAPVENPGSPAAGPST